MPSKPKEPVRRTAEIEEFTNRYLIHPASYVLAKWLSHTPVTPNMVSVSGIGFGLIAAWLVAQPHSALNIALLALAIYLWHVFDGADGQLARMTKQQSEFGKVIDGICDYVTFVSLYIAIAWVAWPEWGNTIVIITVAAALSHAVQSSLLEFFRYEFDYWGKGKASAWTPTLADLQAQSTQGLAGALNRIYMRVQIAFTGAREALKLNLKAKRDANPDSLDAVQENYRVFFTNHTRHWLWLSANKRTMTIVIVTALGHPEWYLFLELAAFNLILMLLLLRQNQLDKQYTE